MRTPNEMTPIARDQYEEFVPNSKRASNKKTAILSVLGLFLVVSCTVALFGSWNVPKSEGIGNEISSNTPCPVKTFDYLLLVQRWAPGVCATTKCVDDYSEQWLIHGLWPNFEDGTWPQFCCPTDPFDVSKVKSLESQLNANWKNLEYGKTAESFWAHEWNKHGTCSSQNSKLVGELGFFNSTLNLYNTYQFAQWFSDNGIVADDSAVLTEARVLSAISPYIPSSKVELHCEHVKNSHVPYLDSISICLDKQLLTPIDCPTPKDTCKQGLIYPTKNN